MAFDLELPSDSTSSIVRVCINKIFVLIQKPNQSYFTKHNVCLKVSYNAAGVLSHLASDGAESWGNTCPNRQAVLQNMVNAIEQWNLAADRNINYRSFEPILQLAKVRHTPQCQHWAIWALANLTKVYRK